MQIDAWLFISHCTAWPHLACFNHWNFQWCSLWFHLEHSWSESIERCLAFASSLQIGLCFETSCFSFLFLGSSSLSHEVNAISHIGDSSCCTSKLICSCCRWYCGSVNGAPIADRMHPTNWCLRLAPLRIPTAFQSIRTRSQRRLSP